MPLRQTAALLLCTSSIAALSGCGGLALNPLGITVASPSVTFSPAPATVAASSSVTLNAVVANSTTPAQWTVVSSQGPNGSGSLNATYADTVTYTAPATPPIYIINGLYGNGQQGMVSLGAYVPYTGAAVPGCTPQLNCPTAANATLSFLITTPAVAVGVLPTAAGVALGSTIQLSAYAVGSTNGTVAWQVGGGSPYGTVVAASSSGISNAATYTAPAVMPMTGPTVTITAISQADPTKTASAIVTLH